MDVVVAKMVAAQDHNAKPQRKMALKRALCRLTLSRRFIAYNAVTTGDEALTRIRTY
jgi:hypothetical protein